MKIELPGVVKKEDGWWIPRLPPHYMQSHGPYDTRAEAESDRRGMQRTINGLEWLKMVEEIEESENDANRKEV